MTDRNLKIWTITKFPKDFPGKFVVRMSVIGLVPGVPIAADPPWAVVDSLAAARQSLPEGLHCMPRQPEDDPVIVECWL